MSKQKKILVIEDDLSLQKAIKLTLKKNNFSVLTARSVDEAIKKLKTNSKIDLIWLDHYLMGMEDGLDFINKIKDSNSEWKNIPIFVISNTASADKVTTYLSLGVGKYYTKANHRLDDIIVDLQNYIEK